MDTLLLPLTIGHHTRPENLNSFNLRQSEDDNSATERYQGHSEADHHGDHDPLINCTSRERTRSSRNSSSDSVFYRGDPNPIQSAPRNDRPHFRQDGFISALTLFVILLAVSWSVTGLRFLTRHQSVRVKELHNLFILILYMSIACAAMWVIISWKNTPRIGEYILASPGPAGNMSREELYAEGRRETFIGERIQNIIQTSLPLIGILVFFTLGLVLDVVSIICDISCLGVYNKCDILFPYSIHLLFDCMRIIFEGTLIVFTFSFHQAVFKRTCFVRYALLLILVAVLSVWFDSVVMFTRRVLPDKYKHDYPQCASNDTSYGNDTQFIGCLYRNDSMYQFYENVAPYLYPLHIEYTLIVSQILFSLYNSADVLEATFCKNCHSLLRNRARGRSGYLSLGSTQTDHALIDPQSDPPRCLEPVAESSPLLTASTQHLVSTQIRRVFSGGLPRTLFISLVINLLNVLLSVLTKLDGDAEFSWHFAYESYKVGYFLLLSVATMLGFYHTRSGTSNFYNYSSLEILNIASTSAYFMYVTLDLVSVISYLMGSNYVSYSVDSMETLADSRMVLTIRPNFPNYLAILTISRGVINASQFYLQITFMMHVSRIKITNSLARKIVREVILALAISNVALWVVDSFVEIENTFIISQFYYGKSVWDMISSVLAPVLMFFRFNSFFMLLNSFLSIKYSDDE